MILSRYRYLDAVAPVQAKVQLRTPLVAGGDQEEPPYPCHDVKVVGKALPSF